MSVKSPAKEPIHLRKPLLRAHSSTVSECVSVSLCVCVRAHASTFKHECSNVRLCECVCVCGGGQSYCCMKDERGDERNGGSHFLSYFFC